MYQLTTFRQNNSASLACGESELKYFNFLFSLLTQLLELFQGIGQVKNYQIKKLHKSCVDGQPGIDIFPRYLEKLQQQSAATVFNYQEK